MPDIKSSFIHVRVTASERAELSKAVSLSGCDSLSEWMRAVMVAGVAGSKAEGEVPKTILIDATAASKLYKEILREGRNLNQASRALNRIGKLLLAALRRPDAPDDAIRKASSSLDTARSSFEEIGGRWDGLVLKVNDLIQGEVIREGVR